MQWKSTVFGRKPSFRREGAPAFLTEEPSSGTFLQVLFAFDTSTHLIGSSNLDFGFWLDCLIQFDGQVQVQRSSSSSSLGRRSAPRWPIIILRNIIFCDHISMWFNAVIAYNYKVFSIIEIISNFRSRNPSSDDWTIARQPSYSRSLSDAWLLLINLSLSSTSTWSYILPQAKNSFFFQGQLSESVPLPLRLLRGRPLQT